MERDRPPFNTVGTTRIEARCERRLSLHQGLGAMTKVDAITATTLVLATVAVLSTAVSTAFAAAPPAKPVQPIELTCGK